MTTPLARSAIILATSRRVVQRLVMPRLSNSISRRGFANRFNRPPVGRASGSSTAVTRRPESALASDALAHAKIDGADAQVARVNLTPSDSLKVDPSAIIAVPNGVEVRPIYGAPQRIPEPEQQQQPNQGGFLSRLRERTPAASAPAPNQLTAPMLAEVLLYEGQPATVEPVQLGPATASKLHTINLAEFGHEMFISRSAFLASASSVNVHFHADSGIPGLLLNRLEGEGNVMLKVSGQPIFKDLASGEQMYVQANRLVGVESSVAVTGGEGSMLVTLEGPGKVILQSLPSLEAALVQQAQQTAAILQQNGINTAGMPLSPMGMGGGMGLGSMIMQGMAFGTGSAIAHHAIDSMFGGHGGAAAAPTPAAEAPPAAEAAPEPEMTNDLPPEESGSDGGFFGSFFGGDDGGDDAGGWGDE